MTTAEKTDIYEIERELRRKGISLICGVDEAGRGPLCGPVAAGAVILPEGLVIEGLNDSKQLTEKKRDELYGVITEKAAAWSVGLASADEINRLNILKATFLAMRRAVEGLSIKPEYLLVDGNRDPKIGPPAETLIKGDERAACIAAASVLAKVTRDRLLDKMDEEYPHYGYAGHKGYPTAEHYLAIARHGLNEEYRETYIRTLDENIFKAMKKTDTGKMGEEHAAKMLADSGYRVMERNFRCRMGEIDIIAEKDGVIAFVEVKTRAETFLYRPSEAVTAAKQKKLIKTAQYYLMTHGSQAQPRFDVIAIVTADEKSFRVTEAEHITDAFGV